MSELLFRVCRWGCRFADDEPRLLTLAPAEIVPCPLCGRPVNVRKVGPEPLKWTWDDIVRSTVEGLKKVKP